MTLIIEVIRDLFEGFWKKIVLDVDENGYTFHKTRYFLGSNIFFTELSYV